MERIACKRKRKRKALDPKPAAWERFFGVPLAKGKPSLADHAIGVFIKVPTHALEEHVVFRLLWRDPFDGRPVEVREAECHKGSVYASTFLKLAASATPPPPYTSEDFELLRQHDNEAYARAGFVVHRNTVQPAAAGRMR